MRVYVYLLEGEPLHVYTSLDPIKKEFRKWADDHMLYLTDDFSYWIENHYDGTDYDKEQEDKWWESFLDDMFNEGTWGDYAWYDCFVD